MSPVRLALALSLLAGCASTGSSNFLILESQSFGCGAVEGLGCGLALAPVLQSLDELDGVLESRVSWDGRTFRLELEPGADSGSVVVAAAELLECEACCVTTPRGEAAPAPAGRWFDREETVALSMHEAGVIAADFASEITAEVELDPAPAERLHALLREELEHAFRSAHEAGGGVARLWEELPSAWPRFEARLAEFLTPEQVQQVTTIVRREMDE